MNKSKTVNRLTQTTGNYIRRYSPVALSFAASIGVIATAISAVKATPKAIALIEEDSRKNHNNNPHAYTKKEALTSAWKCYIPSVVMGASTIVCIMGANVLNRRQQVSILSAYSLVQSSYTEYKNKLKEMYGEETHNTIIDTIAKEKSEKPHISCPGLCSSASLDFGDDVDSENLKTFYDSFSDRYFESTIERVIQAEYHLNRNFMLKGVVTLNEFYEFLGISTLPVGESLGWTTFDGDIFWIDFDHRKVTLDDGMEIYIIDMVFDPTTDWMGEI